MERYTCSFYETTDGKSPVEDFIESLDNATQKKFIYKNELLATMGPRLREPHSKSIGDGIFELRFEGKEGQIRVLFFFLYKKHVVYLHGFIKKTQKTPRKEINIAKQRKADYFKRF